MKHYGWGMVGKGGKPQPVLDEEKNSAEDLATEFNEEFPDMAPYRVVELFYKEEE